MLTKSETRQWPLADVVRFGFSDLVDGESAELAALLQNEVIISGSVVVVTAWNVTGSGSEAATIDVGDADDPNRYSASPISLAAAGRTALTITGHKYTGAATLLAAYSETSDTAVTEGEAFIEFVVLREGRGNEVVA